VTPERWVAVALFVAEVVLARLGVVLW